MFDFNAYAETTPKKVYRPVRESEVTPEMLVLLEQRKQARAKKDFQLADKIRCQLTDMGFHLVDRASGDTVLLR